MCFMIPFCDFAWRHWAHFLGLCAALKCASTKTFKNVKSGAKSGTCAQLCRYPKHYCNKT